jgi:hypothetical protein
MRTSLAPLLLLALAAPVRSEVHTVGPPGSGADFTTIQAAVDAAAAGDTVLVAAGDYTGFSMEKPILVLGAGSEKTKVTSLYPVGTGVSVAGIPAEKVAVVAGMSFDATPGAFIGSGIALLPAEGTVVLHDLKTLSEDFGQLEATGSARLVLSHLALTSSGSPGASLRGYSSRIWLVDSRLTKSMAVPIGFPAVLSTARLVDCDAFFAGCTLIGSDVEPTWTLQGGSGLELKESQVVAGRTTFLGGDGATTGAGGFAAALTGASTLVAGADALLQGGLDGSGLVEQAPVSIETGSTFFQGSAALPTLSASPPIAKAGDQLALALHGKPGASGALFVSLAPGAGASFPGLIGEVFLDLAAPIALAAVSLDASGEAHLSVPVPALPEPALATFQWAALSSLVELSNPAFVGVE